MSSLKLFGYKKCDKLCSTCKYANEVNILILANGFYFPFFEKSNCNSKNLIYLIECKKCQYYYIGETSLEIKKRLSTHLSNIKCSVPYDKNSTAVAYHFNRKGHCIETDFSFYILKLGLGDIEKRLFHESVYISLFQHFNLNLINKLENISSFNFYRDSTNFNFFQCSQRN